MADNQPVPMPPHIKAELARLRALMIPDAEAYRRREIGSKRMEEEAKKIQPLRPLSAADTDVQYPLAAKGGRIQHKWHGGPIVDSLVGTFPSLAPVANAIGATKIGLSEKELPTDDMYWYSNGATRDLIGNDRRGDVNPMLGVPLSTQPTDLPKSIKMYRADPTGKYGGKEGLETLPQPRFDVGGDRYHKKVEDPTVSDVYGDSSKAIQQLYRYARLNGAANKYGYPSLSPEDVAAMALKEGRSDLGFNAVNLGHPDELKFNKMLRDTYNLTSNDQNFLAALFAKQRVADKFKIPFANAWNGTGVNDAGQSGKDYAKNYEHHKKAALHPNNQQLMELINRAIEDGKKHGLPLRENSIKDSMRHYIPVPYKAKGGVIDMDRMRLELMGKAKGGRSSPFKKSKAQYVVYHGTNRNFNTFDPNAKSNTQGGEKLRGTGAHFFTPNKELANAYTGASKSETTGKYHAWPPESIHGGNVMPVYLNMVNPLDIDAEGKMYHQVEHHVKDAKRKGHDSVILRNVVDQPGAAGSLQTHKHDAHIVFNPNQIKSAIGNRGTYDINDPDITKAKGGSVMGVNVASDRKHNLNYADLIVDGHKTIESRNSDTLRPYVGKRVAIVRTGSGKAKAIGEVTIGEPIVANKKQFRNMESHHLVPEGSTFDIKTPTKHMYPLSEPVRYDEERDVGHGIISRKVIHKDKGGKIEVRPTVFDDAASRRNPKIEAAARALMEGEMKQKAYA